jgi:hypothetical protein
MKRNRFKIKQSLGGKRNLPARFSLLIAVYLFLINPMVTAADETPLKEKLQRAPFKQAVFLGNLANNDIIEASGMAASRLRADVLWLLNDGGNEPYLYAAGRKGSDLGRVRILNAPNVDWEDLAAFRFDNSAYLLIADVGDNKAQRTDYYLYIVREPEINGDLPDDAAALDWTWRIRFMYVDGPRDCEAVAVNMLEKKILLLSKRRVPPVLYELPLIAENSHALHIARRVTVIENIPQPTADDLIEDPRFGRFRAQPTALDISPDGSLIAVLAYKNAYLYMRSANDNWSAVFQRSPLLILMPQLRQAEALCFDAHGRSLYVTSEKRPTPIYRLDITDR